MKVLFTVRRNYFDDIVSGIKTEEIRKASKRWLTVAGRYPHEAVFLCGRMVHRREITSITVVKEGAKSVLGRELSEQGRKDVGDGPVVVFWLGRVLP